MDIRKADRRDNKRNRKKNRMPKSGRSVFLIKEIQKKKAEEIRRLREEKEKLLEMALTDAKSI